jgi:long-subunit acyl-CoA synthetase (AMP-forming)
MAARNNHHHLQRQEHHAVGDREPAQILALRFGCGRDRQQAALSHLPDHDRPGECREYAQDHDIPFTNYASLCRAPEIQHLIQREIEAVNVNFARVETIKKFFLIERQLTPEDEELTPTMKLKRSFVNKRYAAEINAMYGERVVA